MLNKVKRIAKYLLYSPAKEIDTRCLFDVFNRGHTKKVLVSYITAPFVYGLSDRHTNLLECYTACEIFDEMNYSVDVIDYNFYTLQLDFSSYDIIYGFGESMEESFSITGLKHPKRIIYGTGCDNVFSNKITLERVEKFYKKTNLLCLSSARLVTNSWRKQIVFSDLIIALGNEFVKNTYKSYNSGTVNKINIFFKDNGIIDLDTKNFTTSKRNFLWWGSAGAVHKGLDLLLDYFHERNDINLYICGYKKEYPFDIYMHEKLLKSSNIFDMGFVEVGSITHFDLLYKCASTILPSASEGGSPGIVNACSTAGLVPILTENCGVDTPEIVQKFLINSFDVEALGNAIEVFLLESEVDIKSMSIELISYFRKSHNFASYKTLLNELISSVTV